MSVDTRSAALKRLLSAYKELCEKGGSTSIAIFCDALKEALAEGFTREEIDRVLLESKLECTK